MSYPDNDWRDYLEHSSKGTHWKKGHKYVAIVNGRYIYPEDLKRKKNSHIDLTSESSGTKQSSPIPTRGFFSSGSSSESSSSPKLKPANLKAMPGKTSGKDKKAGSNNSHVAGRPRSREVYYSWTKKSNHKNWQLKKGTVKKGKKLNLKTKFGDISGRSLR